LTVNPPDCKNGLSVKLQSKFKFQSTTN